MSDYEFKPIECYVSPDDTRRSLLTIPAVLRREVEPIETNAVIVPKAQWEARQWRSVAEKPAPYTPVLILRDQGVRFEAIGLFDAQFRIWLSEGVQVDDVSHWMPLPEAPESE